MVLKSLLLLLFAVVIYVDAQQGNCDIKDPDYEDYWKDGDFWFKIKDSETNYKVDIKTENINDVNLNHKYIEASVANNILTFAVKEDFKDFIKNENSTKLDVEKITFTCANGGTVQAIVTLNVIETIMYPPTFSEKNYEFNLPMPIAKNQIVEATAMTVTDYNIDEDLTFSFIDGDCTRYFEFSTIRTGKVYTSKLKTIDHVNLEKSINCKIQVKDKSGEEDDSEIEIKVDIQNSKVPNPIFKNPIQIVDYAENLNVQLELLSDSYTPKPRVIDDTSSNKQFAKYFKSNPNGNNKIEIVLDEEIPEEELGNINYFVLIVEVEYEKADNVGKTVILIDLNKNTATTTTSTTSTSTTETPECTTTIISTTPCDCTTTPSDPGSTTISTTSESDTSSCPSCPECTTTVDPGSTTTCPSNPECPETTTSPGEGTTCPACPTLPGEGTTCPECPETSTLPGEGTTCPTTCPECPETTTLSGESTTCPTTCPECPETTTLSGEGTTCPSCPETSTLPGEGTTCPTTCPECPETSTFPGEGTTCPTTCPECPETSTLLGENTTCPPCTTSPGETCPECPETSTLGTNCPECPETTTLGTICPECPITCPPNPETCPPNPETSPPGGSTICPECSTTLPGESTTCPSNPECPSTSTDSTTSSLGSSTPSDCDCSTSSPSTTCPPWEPAPEVRFEKISSFIPLPKGTTGYVDTFKAVSDVKDEEITYNIKSVDPAGAKTKFEITNKAEFKIKEELDEGTYDISLTATGKQSKSQDEIMLFLVIENKLTNCQDGTIQVNRLINTNVKEGEAKKLFAADGNRLEFTSDNDDILDWFKFNENGDLEARAIDREDERIKSLLAPQIQVKIIARDKNSPPQLRYNFSAISYAGDSQSGYSCLAIKDIDTKPDTMIVLVNVEDENDNDPIFVEKDPLVVGYPEAKLVDFIAPPYLVKVTATDEDFGDNAKIKYTTNDKSFIADAENGIIFLGKELSDDAEFKVIAEDNNGNGGNKAELSVKVKLLKEEHISVITIENIAYSEIEDKVKEISSLTKQTVKYLSSIALPKPMEEEKKLFKVYSEEEKVPAVRIILYALDGKNEIIPAKDFKKIADDTDLGIEIKVEEYAAALPNDHQEDQTGWIAAVSTLSVLLALVIIGGLLGYIFYLRPRMMDTPLNGYKKHKDSIQTSSSIETKMDSSTTLSDRRPTGFPMGFNPTDLDDEDDDEDYEKVKYEDETENTTKMEVEVEEEEGATNSEISSNSNPESEQKPKPKSGVKFDTNVTEIEIEIEEF